MFWAGCGADQNPLPRRTIHLARHYGRCLATAVDSILLTSKMRVVHGCLSMHYAEVKLPLEQLPTRAELLQQSESDNRYMAARAKMLLEKIDLGEPLSQSYPYPIGVWCLGKLQGNPNDKEPAQSSGASSSQPVGQIAWIFLGGEVVVDYALRLKLELSGIRTWVVGYANDVMAYIPSRRVLAEGGYEGRDAMEEQSKNYCYH